MLTAFERDGKRLVQIVLCGQPMLLNTLKTEPMYALNERITRRVALTPLSRDEVEAYIYHRLAIAGGADARRLPAGRAAAHRRAVARAAAPRERAVRSHAAGRPRRRASASSGSTWSNARRSRWPARTRQRRPRPTRRRLALSRACPCRLAIDSATASKWRKLALAGSLSVAGLAAVGNWLLRRARRRRRPGPAGGHPDSAGRRPAASSRGAAERRRADGASRS